jgi:serine/threonine protein kinase
VQLRTGERIDHYTLLKPLGRGGQGSVWEVLDPRDGGIRRALKLVYLDDAGPKSFDRARREAKILASARHPSLVTCHGFFEDLRAGLVGLVMDLVPGGSLGEAAEAGRLDRDHALAALEQLAAVLAYMHGAGLVHRDIKPDNVLLAEGFWALPRVPGMVKLVDFGIAAPAGNPRPLTSLGGVVGTLPYLAPELVDPATWGRSEGPSRDVFAFGVMAWELLFHKHPTGLGPAASVIDYARAYKAADAGRLIEWPPAGLDGALGAAVERCLALRAASRPANGAALLQILWSGPAASAPHAPAAAPPSAARTAPHRAARGLEAAATATALPATRGEPGPTSSPIAPWASAPATEAATVAPSVNATQLPQTIESAPLSPQRSRAPNAVPAAPRRGGWALPLLALFIITAALVVAAAVALDFVPTSAPPPVEPTSPPVDAPPQRNEPIAAISRLACCRPDASCTGPKPKGLACPRCEAGKDPPALPKGASFGLRAAGLVDAGRRDMTGKQPSSALRLRNGKLRASVPFAVIGAQQIYEDNQLRVTTEDIHAGKIHVSIDEGRESIAYVKSPPVLVSALCAGLRMYADDGKGGTMELFFYLDPIASPSL